MTTSKNNRFNDQNNSSACASRFLVHFFDVHCMTAMWNLLICHFMEDVNIWWRIQPFSFWTWIKSLEFNYRKRCLHLTYWASPNRCNSVWKNTNSFFYWCFHCRHHCACLRSLLLWSWHPPIDTVQEHIKLQTWMKAIPIPTPPTTRMWSLRYFSSSGRQPWNTGQQD